MSHEEIISKSLELFNLGNLRQKPEKSKLGINSSYKLCTGKGEYIIKIYNKKPKILEREKYIEQVQKIKDIPIIHNLKSINNNFVEDYNKTFFSISRFIEGEHIDSNFSDKRLINAAKALAILHKETTQIVKEDKFIIKFKKINSLNLVWELEKKCSGDTLNYIEKLKPFVEKYELSKDLVSEKKEQSIIHGDYWYGQVLFNGNEISAILDLDTLRLGHYQYDLIKAIRGFSNKFDINETYIGFDFECANLFLETYSKYNKKLELNVEEILVYLRRIIIAKLSYLIRKDFSEPTNKGRKKRIKGALEELENIDNNEEKYIQLFSKYIK